MKIFYDVDTQNDFMNKDGALYVPDAELIKPNLKKLNDFARSGLCGNDYLIGSVDRHFGTPKYKEREGELTRYGGPFPDHCMDGTFGQKKIIETWFPSVDQRCNYIIDDGFYPHCLDEKVDEESIKRVIHAYKNTAFGLFFEKQSYDIFTNPAFELFLELAEVEEAVVYGVATDYCVKAAVLGMQQRGIQCYVVEDAIKGVAPETTEAALKEMEEAGAKFVTTKQVLEELVG